MPLEMTIFFFVAYYSFMAYYSRNWFKILTQKVAYYSKKWHIIPKSSINKYIEVKPVVVLSFVLFCDVVSFCCSKNDHFANKHDQICIFMVI